MIVTQSSVGPLPKGTEPLGATKGEILLGMEYDHEKYQQCTIYHSTKVEKFLGIENMRIINNALYHGIELNFIPTRNGLHSINNALFTIVQKLKNF